MRKNRSGPSDKLASNVVDLKKHRRALEVIQTDPQFTLDLGISGNETASSGKDLHWSPIFIFQTCLPHSQLCESDLQDGAYVRRNGDTTMEIRTLHPDKSPERFPFGKFPRLFLLWLSNAVTRFPKSLSEDGVFAINTSYRTFCESLGVDHSSGPRGSGRALIEQIVNLSLCTFTITRAGERPSRERNGKTKAREGLQVLHFSVSSVIDLSWDAENNTPKQWLDSLDGGFRLSKDFRQELVERPMPTNPAHITAICKGKSPLRIDLYHFLVYRNWHLIKSNQSRTHIPWDKLHDQFGGARLEYDFIRAFRIELKWIQTRIWPSLTYNCADSKTFVLLRSEHPTDIRLFDKFA